MKINIVSILDLEKASQIFWKITGCCKDKHSFKTFQSYFFFP